MLKRFGIANKPKKLRRLFIVALCATFLLRILQLLSALAGAYVFLALWTVAVMVCMCICFVGILDEVSPSQLGRFASIAYFINAIIVSMIKWFTDTPTYYHVSVLVGLLLCVAAILTFWHQPKNDKRQHRSKSVDTVKVFDKIKWKTVLPVAFVFICAAQSMAFFAQEAVCARKQIRLRRGRIGGWPVLWRLLFYKQFVCLYRTAGLFIHGWQNDDNRYNKLYEKLRGNDIQQQKDS